MLLRQLLGQRRLIVAELTVETFNLFNGPFDHVVREAHCNTTAERKTLFSLSGDYCKKVLQGNL